MIYVPAMHKLEEDWAAPDYTRHGTEEGYQATREREQQQPRCMRRRFVAGISGQLAHEDVECRSTPAARSRVRPCLANLALEKWWIRPESPLHLHTTSRLALVF